MNSLLFRSLLLVLCVLAFESSAAPDPRSEAPSEEGASTAQVSLITVLTPLAGDTVSTGCPRLSGYAPGAARVALFIDDVEVARVSVDLLGFWEYTLEHGQELDDRTHELRVVSLDLLGSLTAEVHVSFGTLRLLPQTLMTACPPAYTSSRIAFFSFGTSHPIANFECSLDGRAYAPCSQRETFSGLMDGAHSLSVRSCEPSLGCDPTPESALWVVDTVPPETTILGGPGAQTPETHASFTLASNEPATVFECSVDGADFQPCTSPFSLEALTPGAHVFEARSRDRAGNLDSSPAQASWSVISFAAESPLPGAGDGLLQDVGGGGMGCASAPASAQSLGWGLLVGLVFLFRRARARVA